MDQDVAPKTRSVAENLETAIGIIEVRMNKMLQYTDAHTIICGIAAIEENLERAIKTKMISVSKTVSARLFNGSGPLGTFAAKLDMTYSLGLISQQSFNDLKAANRLRNRFAHSTKAFLHFGDPAVTPLINAISGVSANAENIREVLLDRLKEIDLELDKIYADHCIANGKVPDNVDASLIPATTSPAASASSSP